MPFVFLNQKLHRLLRNCRRPYGVLRLRWTDHHFPFDAVNLFCIGDCSGCCTVILTGKGNYTGTAMAVFRINPVGAKPLDQKDSAGNELRLEVERGRSTVPAEGVTAVRPCAGPWKTAS